MQQNFVSSSVRVKNIASSLAMQTLHYYLQQGFAGKDLLLQALIPIIENDLKP